jgi:hypothetical protein
MQAQVWRPPALIQYMSAATFLLLSALLWLVLLSLLLTSQCIIVVAAATAYATISSQLHLLLPLLMFS